MLVVTVDLVPGGVEPLRRTIAYMRIANISHLADVSDYSVMAMEAANPLTGNPTRNTECILVGHDRHQTVWAIVEAASAELQTCDWSEM
jgi:hypothetical protein